MSVGKFWYVVADIVFAVNPFVKLVAPVTVPPVKELPVLPVKFTPKLGYVPAIWILVPPVIVIEGVTVIVPPLTLLNVKIPVEVL